ncbi:alpha/beta fold hydrolase [Pseudonocardia parietis]|uniref:Pimeloyl-ACP methyl ester carboxylesterase n=1 Tax=Pseudonocardia parietis TaxID=570936 RepID=A0ABS4W2P6_9PSEU|nr:alpha/beta fold hydrolase [Pseudonocardia parietis]MBP2370482.1 pimeloyl-ACP methyl ester carboxylesterase [Pseudonocardia parietis]
MEREVEVEPGVLLWVEDLPAAGDSPALPVLLVMGANACGIAWPEELVAQLRERHRVVRYDHRDTGRSSQAFEDHPYGIADLAGDALTVLDACGIERAHVVGMSMGGLLVQLLVLDAPERLASAALLCTAALDAGHAGLPGPPLDLLRMWQEMHDPRDERSELAWRVEHSRRLSGGVLPFDPREFAELERRVMAHSGRLEPPTAHSLADIDGLDRGAELGSVTVPTLVVEAPEDPVHPPPHAAFLAERIGPAATLVAIEGMGHALPAAVLGVLAAELLEHAAEAEDATVAAIATVATVPGAEPAQPTQR